MSSFEPDLSFLSFICKWALLHFSDYVNKVCSTLTRSNWRSSGSNLCWLVPRLDTMLSTSNKLYKTATINMIRYDQLSQCNQPLSKICVNRSVSILKWKREYQSVLQDTAHTNVASGICHYSTLYAPREVLQITFYLF